MFIYLNIIFSDIRKIAHQVNEKLKLLIVDTDDDDCTTDLTDEVRVNLVSGSPIRNSTQTRSTTQESSISHEKTSDETSNMKKEGTYIILIKFY